MDTHKLSSLSAQGIAGKAATLINNPSDKHFFTPLVDIAVVESNDSQHISLQATTQFGIRLFFSVASFDSSVEAQQQQQQQQRRQLLPLQPPSTLQLVHVRLPPNLELAAAVAAQTRKGPVSGAYAQSGVTLLVSMRDENADSVLLLERDLFLLHNSFKEAKSVFEVEARVWAMQEIRPTLASVRSAALDNDLLQTAKSAAGVEDTPKLTAEYFDLPRRFAMITPDVS